MICFEFTHKAKKQFLSLEQNTQTLIKEKLTLLKNPDLFQANTKRLLNLDPATHRVRIGSMRLLLKEEKKQSSFLILKVGHRKDIYK